MSLISKLFGKKGAEREPTIEKVEYVAIDSSRCGGCGGRIQGNDESGCLRSAKEWGDILGFEADLSYLQTAAYHCGDCGSTWCPGCVPAGGVSKCGKCNGQVFVVYVLMLEDQGSGSTDSDTNTRADQKET